jgi:hypothetical protein
VRSKVNATCEAAAFLPFQYLLSKIKHGNNLMDSSFIKILGTILVASILQKFVDFSEVQNGIS